MVLDDEKGRRYFPFHSCLKSVLSLVCTARTPSHISHLGTQQRRKLLDEHPVVRLDLCLSFENSSKGERF